MVIRRHLIVVSVPLNCQVCNNTVLSQISPLTHIGMLVINLDRLDKTIVCVSILHICCIINIHEYGTLGNIVNRELGSCELAITLILAPFPLGIILENLDTTLLRIVVELKPIVILRSNPVSVTYTSLRNLRASIIINNLVIKLLVRLFRTFCCSMLSDVKCASLIILQIALALNGFYNVVMTNRQFVKSLRGLAIRDDKLVNNLSVRNKCITIHNGTVRTIGSYRTVIDSKCCSIQSAVTL